jgi:pimeloyl-ACP methyl ester carboxylesterase
VSVAGAAARSPEQHAGRIAFSRRGAGPPLVLLHPLGTDRHVWDPVLDRLAAHREVLAVDLPGFGASPPLDGAEPPSPARLAEAVRAGLEDVLPGPWHVAGNSLGGWVALELALTGAARSVTAIAPAGLWPEPLMPRRGLARRVARTLDPVLPALARTPRGRRLALAASVARPENVAPADALALIRTYATAPGFDAVNDAMRAGRFTALERVGVPVTLAWPDRDRLVARPAHVPPRVQNVVLRGCGHMPFWDDPEQVAGVLLAGSTSR